MSQSDKIIHLEHIEDLTLSGDVKDFLRATCEFSDACCVLTNCNYNDGHIGIKFDGSPAIVFGYHPENGKWFVATKSAFNTLNPKIAYDHNDIKELYGDRDDLYKKMYTAFDLLKEITPYGVFQGDILYDDSNLHLDDSKYHFTANTITYVIDEAHDDYHKMDDHQLGLCIHTHYIGSNLEDMTPQPVNPAFFGSSPFVHIIWPTVECNTNFPMDAFDACCDAARQIGWSLKPVGSEHAALLKMFINKSIRDDSILDVVTYCGYLINRGMNESLKLKTEAGRVNRLKKYSDLVSDALNNHEKFALIFKVWLHLHNAKMIIIQTLDQSVKIGHYIDNEPAKPEGYVFTNHYSGMTTKLVDRFSFSKQNFLKSKNN